jgi:hypothetical protein
MTSVRFFPSFALSSLRNNSAGAWRVWLAARSLAGNADAIEVEGLKELCEKYVTPRTFARWLKQANTLGLLRTVTQGTRVMIQSEKRAAITLQVKRVESHRVEIKIKHILGHDWRAYVWAAQEALITSGPISRVKLQQITGKSRNKQRLLEKRVGTTYKKNITVTEHGADCVPGLREQTGKPYFKLLNNGKWVAACRKPDQRNCSEVTVIGCGNSRNINATLTKSAIINYPSGQGLSVYRIFHDTPEQVKRTMHYVRKQSILDKAIPHEIYLRAKRLSTGGNAWEAIIL